MRLEDIAIKCGVSPSTVSRALNNDPRISRETLQKIHETAAKYKFVPSKRKRSSGRSKVSLLLVIPDSSKLEDNPFFEMGDIINAINSAFGSEKTSIETITHSQMKTSQQKSDFNFHGVLFAFGQADTQFKEFLDRKGIPYIFLNRTFENENYVSCNNFKGILRLVNYLKSRKYKRIGYLGCPSIAVNEDRFRGFHIASFENYGAFNPGLVVNVESIQQVDEKTATRFLDENCDAVIGFNDNFAIRLVSAFQNLNVKVPGEMAVTGFDNSPLRRMFKPLLTTISLSTFEMGFFAARWLSDNIIHKESRQLRLEVDGQLLPGESTE